MEKQNTCDSCYKPVDADELHPTLYDTLVCTSCRRAGVGGDWQVTEDGKWELV